MTNQVVAYSSDYGATFSAPVTVGTAAASVGGFDVEHNGTVTYATMALKTRKASTLGGAYSDDQSFDTSPMLIEIPWGKRNSSVLNTGANPEYIVGLSGPDGSGNTLYWIVSGSPVDITPVIGGFAGIPAGPDSLCTWLGKYVAFLGIFNGTKKLVTSTNGGTSWTDRGADDALYLRLRRLAKSPGQLYPAGATLKYTSTFGATLISKPKPNSSDLVFFEPVG